MGAPLSSSSNIKEVQPSFSHINSPTPAREDIAFERLHICLTIKMAEIIGNDTINETLPELDCGEFPDLEKMKVIISNKWKLALLFSLLQGLELLSWGSKHSCDRQFWCLC